MRGLPGARLILGLPQPFGQSSRKGVADLIGRRGLAAPTIAQPHASRLAEPNRHRKRGRSVERSRGRGADDRNELDELACAIAQRPPEHSATADGAGELREHIARPGHAVALRQRAQHQRQDAGEAAHADERDRYGAGASRGDAIAVDQWPRTLAYAVALGIALRAVKRLIGRETVRFERLPQRLDAKILRRKSILRQGEIERHELRRSTAQVSYQLALMRQRM